MDTHLSTEEIRNYLGRKLSQHDFNRASDHVHSCKVCYRDFLAELQERFPIEIDLDELAGMQGWHLEGEELAAYVEGRMDELNFECASLHLEECGSCMEKTSAAFEYRLEHPRLSPIARRKQPSTWSRYLHGFQSISTPRLQLVTAAVLLLGMALFMWALLHPRSEKSQLAGTRPPETVSPHSPGPPTVPVQPAPGAGSDIGKKVDESTPNHVPTGTHSEKGEVRRQEDQVDRALIAKNLTMPLAIELLDRTPAIAVRGNPSFNPSFKIIRPFATVVMNDRPTFRWTELSGATSYTVSVFDSELHLIRTSEPLTELQWLMPESLEAGIVYTWTVTALKDGREVVAPAPPARAEFMILGDSQVIKLHRMLWRTDSHAVRGVHYAEAGLLDEAEQEFRTHLTLSPADDSAKKLLGTVESWRRSRPSRPTSPAITRPAH
jgi:hypothetical protein